MKTLRRKSIFTLLLGVIGVIIFLAIIFVLFQGNLLNQNLDVGEEEVKNESVENEASSKEFKVVGYYPSWKADLTKLRFDILTHVNYAFAIPTTDGNLRPLDNPELVKQVIELAHQNDTKICLAIGGWSYHDIPLEDTFVQATNSSEKIKKFGDAIIKMCNQYGFDGIDMDWEYPRVDGDSGKQYEELMLYLGKRLREEGKILTSAVISGVTEDGEIYYDAAAHSDKVLAEIDWINVMAYDEGDGGSHSSYQFAVDCGNYWTNIRQIPSSKVVLGVPFYARPGWASYEEITKLNENAHKKDTVNFNGMDVFYNGQSTIEDKTIYATENLGGIMIWEITQDSSDWEKSLLTTIGKILRKI